MKKQTVIRHKSTVGLNISSRLATNLLILVSFVLAGTAVAQDSVDTSNLREQVRWQSESKVRQMLGDPQTVRGPIGTHASYQIWNYDNFSIAFANNRAFHLFDKASLRKLQLEETR